MLAIVVENEPLWKPLRTSALNSCVGEWVRIGLKYALGFE
jgi:hypothetical protein